MHTGIVHGASCRISSRRQLLTRSSLRLIPVHTIAGAIVCLDCTYLVSCVRCDRKPLDAPAFLQCPLTWAITGIPPALSASPSSVVSVSCGVTTEHKRYNRTPAFRGLICRFVRRVCGLNDLFVCHVYRAQNTLHGTKLVSSTSGPLLYTSVPSIVQVRDRMYAICHQSTLRGPD